MTRSILVALALATGADASAYTVIAGYEPGSAVEEHARIDLSANAIEQFVGGKVPQGSTALHADVLAAASNLQQYILAEAMYNSGGGRSSAYVTYSVTGLTGGTAVATKRNANERGTYTCVYKATGGDINIGSIGEKSDIISTQSSLKVYMSDTSWASKQCGKVPFTSAAEDWTTGIAAAGTGTYGSESVFKADDCPTGATGLTGTGETLVCTSATGSTDTLTFTLTATNAPSYGQRHLKGFSTSAEEKMIAYGEQEAINAKSFHKTASYGNMHIQMALKAVTTAGVASNAFSTCTTSGGYDQTTCTGTWVQGTAVCKRATDRTPIMDLSGASAATFAARKTYCESTAVGGVVTDFDIWSGSTTIALVTQVIKKMAVYTNAWLYTVHEFEDAIDDCRNGLIANNDAGVHAWDEGVAFWTGSLVGTSYTGSNNGNMNYALANKRCANFKTCAGGALTGNSQVNVDLFAKFTEGYNALHADNCDAAQVALDTIIPKMTVPLIQGTLRYAYKMESSNGGHVELGEGYAFMMSVIHRVGACSLSDANTIYAALDIPDTVPVGAYGLMGSKTYAQVKTAFENNYACMGVTCADVGGLVDGNGAYKTGAAPCVDPATAAAAAAAGDSEKIPTWAIIVIAVSAFLAVVFFGMCWSFKQAKDRTVKMYQDLKKENKV